MRHRNTSHWRWVPLLCVALFVGIGHGPLRAQEQAVQPATDTQLEQMLAQSDFHGGLVVEVSTVDAKRMLTVAQEPNVLVQGLVANPYRLDDVRSAIFDAGLYGRVSAVPWAGRWLPYADGTVNLLLIADSAYGLEPDEILRVLAPLGTAWRERGGTWTPYRKPWPDAIDQWTHARYDASGNAVSKDQQVGPPRFIQWEASPRWNRGVKTSNLVTTHGRLFYILDDSHFATRPPTWALIARDAFSGVRLWRHELTNWGGSRGGKKVGPAQVNRRLVASDKHVFVTLAEPGAVSMLDAATGSVIRTFAATKPAQEFVLVAGTLVVLVDPNTDGARRRGTDRPMQLVAVDPETGKLKWAHNAKKILPLTLAADGQQVVFHDGQVIRSLDLQTGSLRWSSPPTGQQVAYRDQANPDSPGAEQGTILLAPQFAPTMIIYNDVVAFAGGRQLNVVSSRDGHELWRSKYAPSNYSVPVDLFGFEDCLWGPDTGMNLWRPLDDNIDVNAYDRLTGEVKKSVKGHYGFRFQHHRCHQMKVVGDTVVAGRSGVEFLDTDTGEVAAHHWMRGSCYYGILPANGRLYVPPHDCACYVRAKLAGFFSLSSSPPQRPVEIADETRLVTGPAYGQPMVNSTRPPGAGLQSEDWPTYRHDGARSGRSGIRVGSELLLGWQSRVGGRLTSPVVAGDQLYLASADAHTLYAFNAATGEPLWQVTCDGRIDSPPTIFEGLALFGCRDGRVRALRASDGELVWQFSACPQERTIVSHGQLESAWPVHGSVLVVNNVAYFAAGRTSYLDGGLRLYGLDPHTGRTIIDRVLNSRDADGSEVYDEESVDGYLNDVLSSDGRHLFMRHQVFDLEGNPLHERVPHLHSPDGFLSSDTTNRLLWTYAPMYTSPHQGAFYDLRLSRMLFPSGRILVEDDELIFGYGQNRYERPVAETGGQWALFAASKRIGVPLDLTAREYRKLALSQEPATVQFQWWKKLPIQVRAMVQADDVLFVAGPYGSPLTSRAALNGRGAAALLAVSPGYGRVLSEMALPSAPVWDGIAAAQENLYMSLTSGQVLCLWSADSGRPGTPLSPAAWGAALPAVKVEAEPGLIGRWRFDEGKGMLARDCSGRGHDATVTGSWAPSERGTCLVADATPRAAVIPDSPHLQFGTDDFTLAFWVQVEGYGVRLLGKEAFPENWWVVNVKDNGQAELVLGEGRGPGATVRASTTTPLPVKTWNQLVAVVDRQAGQVRWYVNGQPAGQESIPATMTKGVRAAGRDISIPSSHKPFRGLISDFRVYSQALSADRARRLYEKSATNATK